jgi:pantoate--beta-alanine ligase
MKIFNSISKWRDLRPKLNNKSIGAVLTMGNLHAGHLSLLKRSVQENDITVLSIFVNPTQFNDKKDFTSYPNTFNQDITLAEEAGADYILAPDYKQLYPCDYRYKITETKLSGIMEGRFRPGHFDGVLTVVMKILMIVKASKTYFCEKDFQQLQLVTEMTKAFFLDTEVIPCPIIRDNDGLALSSRNSRLNNEQKKLANNFPKILAVKKPIPEIITELTAKGFTVEYVKEYAGRRFGAVRLGDVRLIDNICYNDIYAK